MNKTKVALLLGITAILCYFPSVSATTVISGDEDPILISPRQLDLEGAPRSVGVEIRAYYDTDLSFVCATLSNAGTAVTVEFVNHTTNETADYVIPGSGSSFMPISGTSGYWSVTFTLADGDVYYGEFVL